MSLPFELSSRQHCLEIKLYSSRQLLQGMKARAHGTKLHYDESKTEACPNSRRWGGRQSISQASGLQHLLIFVEQLRLLRLRGPSCTEAQALK